MKKFKPNLGKLRKQRRKHWLFIEILIIIAIAISFGDLIASLFSVGVII